jgi:hypothetical protein
MKTHDEQNEAGIILAICIVLAALIVMVAGVARAEIDMDRIAMIESSGNPLAWNKADDSRGLFQITPICLKEWNNFHPKNQYSMDDLWNPIINREIAEWYITKRIPQMIRYYGKPVTDENIIISYNAGISYVKTDKPLPQVTRDYLRKYGAR